MYYEPVPYVVCMPCKKRTIDADMSQVWFRGCIGREFFYGTWISGIQTPLPNHIFDGKFDIFLLNPEISELTSTLDITYIYFTFFRKMSSLAIPCRVCIRFREVWNHSLGFEGKKRTKKIIYKQF